MDCVDKLKEQYPELSTMEARKLNEAYMDLNLRYANELEYLNSLRKEMYNQAELAAYERQAAEVTYVTNLRKNLDHVMQPAFRGKADMGADSLVIHTPYAAKNQTRNASDIAHTFKSKYEGMLEQALEKNGAINQFGNPEFDRAIFKDFYDRYWKRHTPNKYGQVVTEAVDSIIKVNKSMINNMRASGSTIQFNESHLVAQNYDPSVVLANKDEWISDMMKHIDLRHSFGPTGTNPDTAMKYLEDMATKMGRIDLEKKDARFSVMGGKRSIIYKDGDGAYDMMMKYGYSDLVHGLKSGINRLSKKHGLVSVFGNEPNRGIGELKAYVSDVMSKDVNFSDFDKGVGILKGTGIGFQDPNGIIAKAVVPTVKATKTIATLRYLGSSAPKILMDLPLTVLTNTAQGASIPRATMNTLVNAIESVTAGSVGRRELAREVWQHLENHKMALYSDLEGKPDNWTKVATKFYSLSGMSYLGELTQNIAMRSAMDTFTDIIKKGATDKLKIQNIQRGGFSGSDATTLRKILEASGESRLSPYSIMNTNIGIDAKYKGELADKLATHYLQLTNESITTTDTRIAVWQQKQLPMDDTKRMAMNVFSTFLTSITKETININKAIRTMSDTGKVRSPKGMALLASTAITFALMDYVTDKIKDYWSGNWEDTEPTKDEFRKHMIDSGSWGLIINGIVRTIHGQTPVGMPAPFSIVRDVVKNVENEFSIATGDINTIKKQSKKDRKVGKKSTALTRQLDFLFNMSPVEKFWATGLLKKIYDSTIEDVGKRSSSRNRRDRR